MRKFKLKRVSIQLMLLFTLLVSLISPLGTVSAEEIGNSKCESCSIKDQQGLLTDEYVEDLNEKVSEDIEFLKTGESNKTFKAFESFIGEKENDYSKAVEWLESKGYEKIEEAVGTISFDELSVPGKKLKNVYESVVPFTNKSESSFAKVKVVYDKNTNDLKHVHAQFFENAVEKNGEIAFNKSQAYISNYGFTKVHDDSESFQNELDELKLDSQDGDREEPIMKASGSKNCGYATQAVCLYHCGVTWTLACSVGGLGTAVICAVGCGAICGFGSSWLCNQI